jgi:putative transposase
MMTVTKKAVPKELLDSLLADYRKPEDLIGENGVLKHLTKLLVEKALEAELADHLGHGKNEPVENVAGNTRNGKSRKTLKGEFGELPIEIPRDRHGTFEPQLIPKHQTRWAGFDDKILSLYARGMTVREIQSHLEEMYGTEVSPTRISSVTDAVIEEVKVWQLCIVHMVRNSLNYVLWKMRAEVAADLKRIYTSTTVDEAEQMLGVFEDKWDDAYLPIS